MQSLIPDLVVWKTQARHAGTRVLGVENQLLEGEERDEGLGSLDISGRRVTDEVVLQGAVVAVGERELEGGKSLREEIGLPLGRVVGICLIVLRQSWRQQSRQSGDEGCVVHHCDQLRNCCPSMARGLP